MGCKTPLQEAEGTKIYVGDQQPVNARLVELYTFLSLNGLTIKKERIIIINKKNWAGK